MLRATPRLRVDAACRSLGREAVVHRCASLLRGDLEDDDFVLVLGGAPARRLLATGVPDDQAYWLRVWGARGLLWAGADNAVPALRSALHDGSWRVREMACKVVAKHLVGDLLEEVTELEADPVLRVRNAARRAAQKIAQAEA